MVEFFIFLAISLIIFTFGLCFRTAKPFTLTVLIVIGLLTYRFYDITAFYFVAALYFILLTVKLAAKLTAKKRGASASACDDDLTRAFSLIAPMLVALMFLVILKFDFKGLNFKFDCFKITFLSCAVTAFCVAIIPYTLSALYSFVQKALTQRDGKLILESIIFIGFSLLSAMLGGIVTKSASACAIVALCAISGYFITLLIKLAYSKIKAVLTVAKTDKTNPSAAQPDNGQEQNERQKQEDIAEQENKEQSSDATQKAEDNQNLENYYFNIASTFTTFIIALILAIATKM